MKKIAFGIVACLLGISVFWSNPQTTAKAEEISDFDCAYSVGTNTDPFTSSIYGCQEVLTYTESEATAAGLPQGFSGEVLSVGKGVYSGEINRGLTLDFSAKKIPTKLVESITFRVYIGDDGKPNDGYPELRIPKPMEEGNWVMRYSFKDTTGTWQEVVLKDGNNSFFKNAHLGEAESFSAISDGGYLNKFELGMRHNGTVGIFYIDSVKIALIPNDGVAPVITYQGKETVNVSQGQKLPFTVSATDALEGEVDVEYVWGDPTKIDEDGSPLLGTHTLTFKARDYFGNTAEKTITVIVEEPDLDPPVMEIPVSVIYAKIGAKPLLSVTATDGKDGETEVVYAWSDGALDGRGRLTEGTHTLTLSAVDLSENITEKTITFIVTEAGDSADVVIDEELLCPDESEESVSSEESEESVLPESSDEAITSEDAEESVSSEKPDESVDSQKPDDSVDSQEPDDSVDSQEPDDSKDSQAPSKPAEKPKKGCGAGIGGVGVGTLFALACGLVLKKRKKNG